jgi:hypothetical protein
MPFLSRSAQTAIASIQSLIVNAARARVFRRLPRRSQIPTASIAVAGGRRRFRIAGFMFGGKHGIRPDCHWSVMNLSGNNGSALAGDVPIIVEIEEAALLASSL